MRTFLSGCFSFFSELQIKVISPEWEAEGGQSIEGLR